MKNEELMLVIEVADESCDWRELMSEGEPLPRDKFNPLLDETNHITAIMFAYRRTTCTE
jgi:hypothetical protein